MAYKGASQKSQYKLRRVTASDLGDGQVVLELIQQRDTLIQRKERSEKILKGLKEQYQSPQIITAIQSARLERYNIEEEIKSINQKLNYKKAHDFAIHLAMLDIIHGEVTETQWRMWREKGRILALERQQNVSDETKLDK